MTDWPGGQAEVLRDIAMNCNPETNRQELRRLCEHVESLIDGTVSGWLLRDLETEVAKLVDSLLSLQATANALAAFLEPYAGLKGTIRLALESGTHPWNIIFGFAGKHPYQVRRTELEAAYQQAFLILIDTFPAFYLALESSLSRHIGHYFSFKSCVVEASQ